MKSSLVYGFVFVSLLALLGGCREASDHTLGPTGAGVIAEVGTGDEPLPQTHNRGINASAHIRWQQVELVAPDGSTSAASFRANYVVHNNGNAAGNFAFLTEEGMVVYRITAGQVNCVGGTDVVVLTAKIVGPNTRAALNVTVNVTPVGATNPACILWDIQDSCSHEASGKHDILESACGS